MDSQGTALAPPVGAFRPPAPRKQPTRSLPAVSAEFGHLTLEQLRGYRTALGAEENKVSYWRRIIQARLDVVRAGNGKGQLDAATLRPVLTDARVGSGRQSLVEILPIDDIPPLPSLAELWDRRVAAGDHDGQARHDADLAEAEQKLSAYRTALHARQADATGELIARYRVQPTLCLSALPLTPVVRRRSA